MGFGQTIHRSRRKENPNPRLYRPKTRQLHPSCIENGTMAVAPAEIKLFGKWSYDDVEVSVLLCASILRSVARKNKIRMHPQVAC